MVEAAPNLELVHPAGIVVGEVPPERSQRDLLPDDDEVRLVALHLDIVAPSRREAYRPLRSALAQRPAWRASAAPPSLTARSRSASRAERSRRRRGRRGPAPRRRGTTRPGGRGRVPGDDLRLGAGAQRDRAARAADARAAARRPTAPAARCGRRGGRSSTPCRRAARARCARPCSGQRSTPTRRGRVACRWPARSPRPRGRRPYREDRARRLLARQAHAAGDAGEHGRRAEGAARSPRPATGPPQCSVAPCATASSTQLAHALERARADAAARPRSRGSARVADAQRRAPRDERREEARRAPRAAT